MKYEVVKRGARGVWSGVWVRSDGECARAVFDDIADAEHFMAGLIHLGWSPADVLVREAE